MSRLITRIVHIISPIVPLITFLRSLHDPPSTSLAIPQGSNVAPFKVCYGCLVPDCETLLQKELHRRSLVVTRCS